MAGAVGVVASSDFRGELVMKAPRSYKGALPDLTTCILQRSTLNPGYRAASYMRES